MCPRSESFTVAFVRGIEALFSQLWHEFIDRGFSRSWQGLLNTVKLKLLSYNLRHCGIVSA
jgi:hypothetical protein